MHGFSHNPDTVASEKSKAVLALALSILPLALLRLLVSDAQVDWDEELYFQIGRHWNTDLIPYRDLFDVKPPAVFVIYKIYSVFGDSMAAVRVIAQTLLFSSVFVFARALERPPFLFAPVLLLYLSTPHILGANTEVLYIPFILFGASFFLRGKHVLAAVMAAIAINIKYTVVLDLLGALVFLAAWRPATVSPRIIAKTAALVILFSLAIFFAFYIYFAANGVDLISETIARNIQYATEERSEGGLPTVVLGIYLFSGLLIAVGKRYGIELPSGTLVLGLIGWLGLSMLQALVTGQYFMHYFAPTFIPLAFLSASFLQSSYRLMRQALLLSLIGTVPFSAITYLELSNRTQSAWSQFEPLCALERFYIADFYLSAYRACDTSFIPHKYMFPPFFEDERFARISGSGGMTALCNLDYHVVARDPRGKYRVFDSGRNYCAWRENGAGVR